MSSYSQLVEKHNDKDIYFRDISSNIATSLNYYRSQGKWDSSMRRLLLPFENIGQHERFIKGVMLYCQSVIQSHETRILSLRQANARFVCENGMMLIKYKATLRGDGNSYPLTIRLNGRFWFRVGFDND